ncbi:MAG: cysteine--tRNA ligase, partial [Vicingaceae bacterium]
MKSELHLYNTLSRKKEVFKPIDPDVIGMYVCGPTVYGDAHLGHAKSYVSFDLIYRYLKHIFPKVKYVQNITDVGHLTDDADEGDDKIAKQSRLEKVDPMAIVEKYMYNYFRDMDALNVERASIYPRPSGHIPEQIEIVEDLVEKGYAYEVNGSVYFDVKKYNENHNYGKLSGRTIEEMMEGGANRTLAAQSEKRNSVDFALWKKAEPTHLMQWNSPWGKGYPGWHIECTVMSQKYLGDNFDIHGGGLENAFPHHECEIAQAEAHSDKSFANYWLHNNMVTINGQKMGKSLGNGIFCHELFSGDNFQLDRAYSPMTVRFFILQSHYRSTLDFSNEALEAASKGLDRLQKGIQRLGNLKASNNSTLDVQAFEKELYQAMNDD